MTEVKTKIKIKIKIKPRGSPNGFLLHVSGLMTLEAWGLLLRLDIALGSAAADVGVLSLGTPKVSSRSVWMWLWCRCSDTKATSMRSLIWPRVRLQRLADRIFHEIRQAAGAR